MVYYIVLFLLFFWCPCMAINISVQYNGGLLPDIILLTQGYFHRRTRLNATKRFCICSLWSHLNVLTSFPPRLGHAQKVYGRSEFSLKTIDVTNNIFSYFGAAAELHVRPYIYFCCCCCILHINRSGLKCTTTVSICCCCCCFLHINRSGLNHTQ